MHWLAITGLVGALALLAGGDVAVAQRTCSALESQLLQLQAGGVTRGEAGRAQMLRQRMARAGCGGGMPIARSARTAPEARRQRGTRGGTGPRAHALRRPDAAPRSEPAPGPGSTYRTMCVRSCDGYYFPVSFSTTRDRFAEDGEACARMCPGAEVALYYHATSEAPEAMMSVAGGTYAELPAAFRYRERFDPDCSCGRKPTEETAGADAEAGDGRGWAVAALPRSRPVPAEDPETVANRQGGFALAEIEPAAFASAHGRFGRPVRQVGPRYGGDLVSDLLVRPVSQ
jgi:hypothetical protein